MRFQTSLCRFGVGVSAERTHKYVVGIHPQVSFANDDGLKPGLRQRVGRLGGPQRILKIADFEIYGQRGRRSTSKSPVLPELSGSGWVDPNQEDPTASDEVLVEGAEFVDAGHWRTREYLAVAACFETLCEGFGTFADSGVGWTFEDRVRVGVSCLLDSLAERRSVCVHLGLERLFRLTLP